MQTQDEKMRPFTLTFSSVVVSLYSKLSKRKFILHCKKYIQCMGAHSQRSRQQNYWKLQIRNENGVQQGSISGPCYSCNILPISNNTSSVHKYLTLQRTQLSTTQQKKLSLSYNNVRIQYNQQMVINIWVLAIINGKASPAVAIMEISQQNSQNQNIQRNDTSF